MGANSLSFYPFVGLCGGGRCLSSFHAFLLIVWAQTINKNAWKGSKASKKGPQPPPSPNPPPIPGGFEHTL